MGNRPIILSIAGYDPSSGAGITADIKTAAALDCFAVTCVTALTVQTTRGVFGMEPVRPDVVRETLFRLADDVEFAAVRIGMLGSGEIAEVVAEFLRQTKPQNVVLDPVLRSTSGTLLIDKEGVTVIRGELLPLCDVVTPNLQEAYELAGMASGERLTPDRANSSEVALPEMRKLAEKLHARGCKSIVITGGHLPEAIDYLSSQSSGELVEQIFAGSRIESRATHGTGCAFATALACKLAAGKQLPEAVEDAKGYVRQAIAAAYPVGKGIGPMNHLFRLDGET
jgi:hydroxymethylpyrimidine/phosphomethylpyrimidine kinase